MSIKKNNSFQGKKLSQSETSSSCELIQNLSSFHWFLFLCASQTHLLLLLTSDLYLSRELSQFSEVWL